MGFGIKALALAGMVALQGAAGACIHHSDLGRIEMSWDRSDIRTIAGKFLRFPAEYHERRIAIVEREDADGRLTLDRMDDAAVAADRLGRIDAAIAWMGRKAAAIEDAQHSPAERQRHLFRFHANLGTFHMHRWIRAGARRDDLADLRTARDHVARSIELNPAATDRREHYQLMFIDWLIDPPTSAEPLERLPDMLGIVRPGEGRMTRDEMRPRLTDYADAEEGLLALIVQGSAYESVDVLTTLARVYDARSKHHEAAMARLRIDELVDDGKGSFYPGAPGGERLKSMAGVYSDGRAMLDARLREDYDKLRFQADAWDEHAQDFIGKRLAAGLHPDSAPGFWDGYNEINVHALTETDWERLKRRHPSLLPLIAGCLGAIVLAEAARRFSNRRRTPARRVALREAR